MPSTSSRQQKFMALCAHNPDKAEAKCPPKKVSREFSFKAKGGGKKKVHVNHWGHMV